MLGSRFSALVLAAATVAVSIGATASAAFVELNREPIAATVPAWPADDSPAGRADLDAVLAAQNLRGAREAREAERDATRGPVEWAAFVLGPRFDVDRLPQTVAMLRGLHEDLRVVQRNANAAFVARPPPTLVTRARNRA